MVGGYSFEIKGSRGVWLVTVTRGTQVMHRRKFTNKATAQKYVNVLKAKIEGRRMPRHNKPQRPVRRGYFG